MTQRETIRAALVDAARAIGVPDADPQVDRPRDPAHGEWATQLALTLARPLGAKPREIAQRLVEHLDLGAHGIAAVEIAGPGFINFRMRADANAGGLANIIAAADHYGRSPDEQAGKVVVEFVSANPTGPLHVGHGRQAALGDAIASLLEWTGWQVSREFYYNDAGMQIANLGASVFAHVRQIAGRESAIPEGG
ncbi:MAG: arginine--tRNA ligase, partial [Gemmatimonadaceae bacterium]